MDHHKTFDRDTRTGLQRKSGCITKYRLEKAKQQCTEIYRRAQLLFHISLTIDELVELAATAFSTYTACNLNDRQFSGTYFERKVTSATLVVARRVRLSGVDAAVGHIRPTLGV